MERIANGQPPLILGDGSQTVDFVYVDDVARANVLAATSSVTDDVFNVGSGEETSLRQLAEALLRVMDSDLQPEFGPERGVNPVPRRVADLSRSRAVLGFEPEVDARRRPAPARELVAVRTGRGRRRPTPRSNMPPKQ